MLSGAVPLDEALVETDTAGLLVLPAGRIPHNPSEVVGSERMRDLIAELSSDHLVVIDAPPALPVTDAMIMAQRVDGIIVVTFMAKSRKEHLKKVLQLRPGRQRARLRHRPQRHPAGPGRGGLRLRDLRLRLRRPPVPAAEEAPPHRDAGARPAASAADAEDPEGAREALDPSLDLLAQEHDPARRAGAPTTWPATPRTRMPGSPTTSRPRRRARPGPAPRADRRIRPTGRGLGPEVTARSSDAEPVGARD